MGKYDLIQPLTYDWIAFSPDIKNIYLVFISKYKAKGLFIMACC